eukprot:5074598-Pyramimonas_sp.AAC.1
MGARDGVDPQDRERGGRHARGPGRAGHPAEGESRGGQGGDRGGLQGDSTDPQARGRGRGGWGHWRCGPR